MYTENKFLHSTRKQADYVLTCAQIQCAIMFTAVLHNQNAQISQLLENKLTDSIDCYQNAEYSDDVTEKQKYQGQK